MKGQIIIKCRFSWDVQVSTSIERVKEIFKSNDIYIEEDTPTEMTKPFI